jgi:hypothetical protein
MTTFKTLTETVKDWTQKLDDVRKERAKPSEGHPDTGTHIGTIRDTIKGIAGKGSMKRGDRFHSFKFDAQHHDAVIRGLTDAYGPINPVTQKWYAPHHTIQLHRIGGESTVLLQHPKMAVKG